MWILRSMIFILVALLSQLPQSHGQNNQCTAAAIATCGSFTCVQTGEIFSCLCSDFTLKPSATACTGTAVTTSTQSPVIIPNQCANNNCPAGSTCVPTNQNPALYVCICPNNIIANPSCPTGVLQNNPCLISNPCTNGGTCVVNQLTLQAVCICPTGSYGPNCGYGCRTSCDSNWCYNGARCANAYGEPFCFCGQNYRGRRCELRHSREHYGYLHHNPRHRG